MIDITQKIQKNRFYEFKNELKKSMDFDKFSKTLYKTEDVTARRLIYHFIVNNNVSEDIFKIALLMYPNVVFKNNYTFLRKLLYEYNDGLIKFILENIDLTEYFKFDDFFIIATMSINKLEFIKLIEKYVDICEYIKKNNFQAVRNQTYYKRFDVLKYFNSKTDISEAYIENDFRLIRESEPLMQRWILNNFPNIKNIYPYELKEIGIEF